MTDQTSKFDDPRKENKDFPAATNTYADGNLYQIEPDRIQADPKQPRQFFDEDALQELSDSIKQNGVLQPIIIRRDENKIWLVAGERRFRAAKMAGLEKIPAILTTGNPVEIALIENIQRENLKPIEEAEAFERMIEEHGYTQEQLAQVIGKARTTITQTLSLNKLPKEIKKECPRADIPKRILVEIARKEKTEDMISLFNQVREGQLTSNEVRKVVRRKPRNPNREKVDIVSGKITSLIKSLAKFNITQLDEKGKNVLKNDIKKLEAILTDLSPKLDSSS